MFCFHCITPKVFYLIAPYKEMHPPIHQHHRGPPECLFVGRLCLQQCIWDQVYVASLLTTTTIIQTRPLHLWWPTLLQAVSLCECACVYVSRLLVCNMVCLWVMGKFGFHPQGLIHPLRKVPRVHHGDWFMYRYGAIVLLSALKTTVGGRRGKGWSYRGRPSPSIYVVSCILWHILLWYDIHHDKFQLSIFIPTWMV